MTALDDMPLQTDDVAVEGFAMRLLGSMVGLMDLVTIRLGSDLGYYAALATGPQTSVALAGSTATDERYTREWLAQQAVTGILEVEDSTAGPSQRRYSLPAAHAEVLINRDSPAYLGAVGPMTEVSTVYPLLEQAFRDGSGVAWAAYGDAARKAQAELNRPGYLTQLGREWIPAMPEIEARLRSPGGARVADVGCGSGWSSIAFALAYPGVQVDGIDIDDASIADARANAAAAGVADRVRFEVADAAAPGLDHGAYDLVIAFETIHDMARPVEALAAMRALAAEDGFVVVADQAVAEEFIAPGSPVDRLVYGSSVLVCLPAGRSGHCGHTSAATGAAMTQSTFEAYAQSAGFTGVDVAPVPHPFWRFYLLQHPR